MTKAERIEMEADMFQKKAEYLAKLLIKQNRMLDSNAPEEDIIMEAERFNAIVDFAFETDGMETNVFTNTGDYLKSEETRYTFLGYRYRSKIDNALRWDQISLSELNDN